MRLAIDIGNTNIVIGIFDAGWKYIWRLETSKTSDVFTYIFKLSNLLLEAEIEPKDIKYKVLSSVVPELKDVFVELLEKLNDSPLIILDKRVYDELDIEILNPDEIGTDLVANAMAAHHYYKGNQIVIDFGTALTFTVINQAGKIIGVNIVPGLRTAIDVLGKKASQLDVVPVEFPKNPIGTNTVEAIQNGVLIGYIGLIKHMIAVIRQQLGPSYKTLATGGLSTILAHRIKEIDNIDSNLTLNGLLLVGEKLLKQNKE